MRRRPRALEAWRNINAIDDVCREIITCTRQLVVTSLAGNAGAGGVMLALGADRVIVRDGVVLNPHYRTMGLYGSEYWTYVLPRRVGAERGRGADRTLPADRRRRGRPHRARRRGAPRAAGRRSRTPSSTRPRSSPAASTTHRLLERKRGARAADERRKPLEAYRVEELAEMSRDIFDDRHGFADARRAFVTKRKPTSTPARIAPHRRAA